MDTIAFKIKYAKQLRDCKQMGPAFDILVEAVEEMHTKQVEDNKNRKEDTSVLLDMANKLAAREALKRIMDKTIREYNEKKNR